MVKKKTDERRPCIYCARNKITNKYYVGQTRYGLKHRQIQHFDRAYNKKRNTRFCRALRRYGKDNFVWETLYIVRKDDLTPEQLQFLLNMREKAWVKYFNSFENGYNQDEGGSGGVRYKYATLEEKRKAKTEGTRYRRSLDRKKWNSRQNAKRAANREEYNAARKARREIRGEEYRQQRKEYRDKKEALNPELKTQRLESHKKYMKENQQQRKEYRDKKEALNPELKTQRLENQNKRRAKKRDKINARQNAKRAAKIAEIGHEAYRAQFNERRRKRKEQKLIETNN